MQYKRKITCCYNTVLFRFLQTFYGLAMKRKVYKLYTTRSIKKDKKDKE